MTKERIQEIASNIVAKWIAKTGIRIASPLFRAYLVDLIEMELFDFAATIRQEDIEKLKEFY